MLVLSRKPFEAIVLSNGTTLKILRIERGRVRVGVEAPPGVHIMRSECMAARHKPIDQAKRVSIREAI